MTDDQQDRNLAEVLAVPPLDDLTRRRLVRTALDAVDEEAFAAPAPTGRSWAPLVAAAVVLLLVVAGLVALSTGDDDSSSDTAARRQGPDTAALAPESSTESGAATADATGPAEPFTSDARSYGDLGDLTIPATRSSVRAEISGARPPSGEVAEGLAARVAAADCAAALRGDGTTVVGLGTATVEGHEAAVVVLRAADGVESGFVLVFEPCSVTPL